jgi:hypothetical protein
MKKSSIKLNKILLKRKILIKKFKRVNIQLFLDEKYLENSFLDISDKKNQV